MKTQLTMTLLAATASTLLAAGSADPFNDSPNMTIAPNNPSNPFSPSYGADNTAGYQQPYQPAEQYQPQAQMAQPVAQYQTQGQFQAVGPDIQASKLIGKSVKDGENRTVCQVEDIVVDLRSSTARYAVVKVSGKRIAVPLNAIQLTDEGTLTMAASRQDLENASTTPGGAWANVSGQPWTQNIQGFYGDPNAMNGRFERESPEAPTSGREPARSPMEGTQPAGQ